MIKVCYPFICWNCCVSVVVACQSLYVLIPLPPKVKVLHNLILFGVSVVNFEVRVQHVKSCE